MTGHSAATQIERDANQRPAGDRQGLAIWWRTGVQPEQLVLVLVALPEYELRYSGGVGQTWKPRDAPRLTASPYTSSSRRASDLPNHVCMCTENNVEARSAILDRRSHLPLDHTWPYCWALKEKYWQLTSLTPFLSNPMHLHSTPCQRCGCILVCGKKSISFGLVTTCRMSLRVYSNADYFVGSFTHHTHSASRKDGSEQSAQLRMPTHVHCFIALDRSSPKSLLNIERHRTS